MTVVLRPVAMLLAALLTLSGAEAQTPPPTAAQIERARLLQQLEAQRITHPEAAVVAVAKRRIKVPDLSPDGAIQTFESRVNELCRTSFRVGRSAEQSSSPAGSIVRQDPIAGTVIVCGQAVTVFVAVPPAVPAQPAQPIEPTQPSGADKPQAPWRMPDMSHTSVARLRAEGQGRCDAYPIDELSAVEDGPAGKVIAQYPDPGTELSCTIRPSVTRSLGPAPPPQAPDDGDRIPPVAPTPVKVPDQPWVMPDMAEPGADTLLDREAQDRCAADRQPRITRSEITSAQPTGALISQKPAAGSKLRCGAAITIIRAFQSAPEPNERSWWPIVLGVAAIGAVAAAAFLRHALLHPRVVTGAVGFAAAPGDGWTGGPIARIALVSGGAARAIPPTPLPIDTVEIADV